MNPRERLQLNANRRWQGFNRQPKQITNKSKRTLKREAKQQRARSG